MDTDKPKVLFFDGLTGESVIREMTDDEVLQNYTIPTQLTPEEIAALPEATNDTPKPL